MGNVGKNVAQIALHGFHMRVVYHSRTRKPEVEKEIGIEWAPSLSDLLKQSDVVTLHPPYGTETIGLIGTDEFKLMKKNAILINIARPAIVDPKALHNALKKKLISGAAIDGYYEEPIPSKVKDKFGLVEFPKEQLIITPHVAFNTDNSLVKMKDMFLSSILAVFRNENEIPHLINPEYKNFARSQYPWRKK